MTIIYYLSTALFRWDIKWIIKLRSMWGITRLSLVFVLICTIMFDGYHIHDTFEHIQRINNQLARISDCMQKLGQEPNVNWSFIKKFEAWEPEVREDANLICSRVDQHKDHEEANPFDVFD